MSSAKCQLFCLCIYFLSVSIFYYASPDTHEIIFEHYLVWIWIALVPRMLYLFSIDIYISYKWDIVLYMCYFQISLKVMFLFTHNR